MPKRKYYRHILEKHAGLRIGIKIIGGLIFLFFCLIMGVVFIFLFYAKDLPRPEKFTETPFIESSKIYDRTGKIILAEIYGEEKRRVVSLGTVPKHVKDAIIVTEDANFYTHKGVDLKGSLRAILVDIIEGSRSQGGSTISQQLVRSALLSGEKTVKRKVREIILTLELERRYSKDQILEFYLNQIPLGETYYGVEAASEAYFGKSVADLSVGEGATLAALIKAPTYYSPYGANKDKLLERRDYVLDRMVKYNFIPGEEAEKEKKEPLKFMPPQAIKAPHFVFFIRDYLVDKYGEDVLKEKGLKIITTLDWGLQEEAERVVKEGAKANEAYRAYNAALVAMNPKTGEILAMVGSRDFWADPYPKDCSPGKNCLFDPQYNVATSYPGRQPGSAFKPFVYVTAFRKGYNDKTVVVDEFTDFNGYQPRNYDGLFRGPVTLRQALAQSLNVPSVKVLANFAGLEDSIKTAKDFGITTLNRDPSFYGLPLVLGGGEVRPLDMVSAFGTFATGGYRTPTIGVLKVEDSAGNILEKNKPAPHRVIEPEPVALINSILSDNEARAPMFGYTSAMYFVGYQVAAKTGTTSDYKDGWIIGYSPTVAVGVWAGNSDNSPIRKEPGVYTAAPIWRNFMNIILPLFPNENLLLPSLVELPPSSEEPPSPGTSP